MIVQREESMKLIRPRMNTARRGGWLLMDFKAWAAPVAIGPLSMRERLDRWRTRAVWEDRAHAGARLAVTVTEHVSATEALQALAIDLEANQLADLPAGPSGLGEISFVHPDGVP